MYCDPEQKTEDVGEYFTCSKFHLSIYGVDLKKALTHHSYNDWRIVILIR